MCRQVSPRRARISSRARSSRDSPARRNLGSVCQRAAERSDVDPDIRTIRRGTAEAAGGGKSVISTDQAYEADGIQRGGKGVASRICDRPTAGDHVPCYLRIGKVTVDRRLPRRGSSADEPVLVVRRDVVAIYEAPVRRAVDDDERTGLHRGVVFDDDVRSFHEQLKEPAATIPLGSAHVLEQIVADQHAPGLLARMQVITTEDVDAGARVADDVVDKRHVFDDRPRRSTVLVAYREEDREPVLRVDPVALEDVSFDEDSQRVLQLEEVFD